MTKIRPLVYIVIANWKQYELTNETLKSLKHNNYDNYKVVLIDNESQSLKIKKLIKDHRDIIVIKNSVNQGFSKAYNQGIALAIKDKADFMLLLNNDVEVKKDFLTELINYYLTNSFTGLINPKILYYNTQKIWAMGGYYNPLTCITRMVGQGKESSKFKKVINVDFASGCALMANSEIFEKTGFLNEKLFAYYEDTDFSFRCKKAGYSIKAVPKSIVWHKVSKSTKHKNENKLGDFQSYLYAKNGIIFGFENFHGFYRFYYLLNSLSIKTMLYLIFKCEGLKAKKMYIKGSLDGFKVIFHENKKEKIFN